MLVFKRKLFGSIFSVTHFIAFITLLYVSFLYCEFAFDRKINLPISIILLIFLNCLLLHFITNLLSKLVGFIWLWWMIFGCAFVAAHSFLYSNEVIDIEKACFIHLVFLLTFLFGVFLLDSKSKINNTISKTPPNIFNYIFIIYPFLMFAEATLTLGYVPMLTGSNIIDTMYESNYGKLYNYKFVMLFSILFTLHYLVNSKENKQKIFAALLLTTYFLISLFDGKRVVFLAGIIMVFCYLIKVYGEPYIKKWGLIGGLGVGGVYSGISALRAGGGRDTEGIHGIFMRVGTEFKDFAWTVTHFEPGTIPNYSWILSSLGAFINGFILSIVDVDKRALLILDSARAWRDIYGIELGIRTGIFSELWFEFGYFGLPVIFLFGLLLSIISTKIYRETAIINIVFYLLIYAFILLAIMGQSSVFFGVLITSIYVVIAWSLTLKISPHSRVYVR